MEFAIFHYAIQLASSLVRELVNVMEFGRKQARTFLRRKYTTITMRRGQLIRIFSVTVKLWFVCLSVCLSAFVHLAQQYKLL